MKIETFFSIKALRKPRDRYIKVVTINIVTIHITHTPIISFQSHGALIWTLLNVTLRSKN